jgi:hypothetical protein
VLARIAERAALAALVDAGGGDHVAAGG